MENTAPLFEKGVYRHHMIKEIHEQPKTVQLEIEGRIKDGFVDLSDLGIDELFDGVQKIYMIGCGTAYHAGLVGRTIFEKLLKVAVESDIASEFGYRDIPWGNNQLMIVISQSGETTDTLVALRKAKERNIPVLAITNVKDSTIAREADRVIYTNAGPEIAIASTKAYTSQVVVLYLLALYMAKKLGTCDETVIRKLTEELNKIADYVEQTFAEEEKILQIAWQYQHMENTFFLGRGLDCATAMEGSLKLKETSYVHAEAYATGELKHGPLALITEGSTVITVITQDHMVDKCAQNLREIKNRGGKVIAVCKSSFENELKDLDNLIFIPDVNPIIAPIVSVIPLQIFAYYMATFKGNDVDKPRNLTKSVQVE
ncbi:MAG: glutamine--fructose-6-phosphate transaminase (isomerizing) [Syntrophomonadaceae bacterium]|nr:glutamine--fructose-6-phosphate transaminase (isomerizing) [Syntrophomonadaceae bacterium]